MCLDAGGLDDRPPFFDLSLLKGVQRFRRLLIARINYLREIEELFARVRILKRGDLKAYAVTAKDRIAVAPDIPTTDEAGLPGFYFSFWHAMWAPRGTPKPIIARLNAAIVAALEDADTRKKLLDLAQVIYPHDQQTPEALHAFQKAEIEKWWPIIKAAGIKPE